MRLKVKPRNTEARRWFAWRPAYVHESRTWVWLESVIRRPEVADDGGWVWYYRLPNDSSGDPT